MHQKKTTKQADIVKNAVSMNEDVYDDIKTTPPPLIQSNTSPLLLDSVITPIQEEETCTCSSDAVVTMKCVKLDMSAIKPYFA